MSRPGITYQEVANAAIQLQGQNENPTVDRVREILETGSKTTIARHLKEWKSKTGHIEGTDGVPHELISIVKGLWETIRIKSDQRIEQHQQEINQTLIEIKQNLTQEQKHSADLQERIHQLEAQLHQEKQLSQTLQQSFEEEKRINSKLSERNDRLSEQLSNQKLETDRLHQLLTHVQNNLEHYQLSVQKLREEQMLFIEKQKTAHEHETASLKQDIECITEIRNRLQLDGQQLQAEIKLLSDQKETLIDEKNHYHLQLQEKIISEKILQTQLDKLQSDFSKHQEKIQQQLTMINNHEKNIAVLNEQTLHLKKFLDISENHIRVLLDEKLLLAQEKSQLEGQLKQTEKMLHVRSNKIIE